MMRGVGWGGVGGGPDRPLKENQIDEGPDLSLKSN